MVAGKKLHGQDQIIVSLAVGPVSSGSSIEVKDNFVNRVAEKCGGAVVRIQTEQKVEIPSFGNADIFSFFFGIKPEVNQKERKIKGQGSGFCVDGAAGVVLTNAHVVQGADRILASFPGKRVALECEILETDEVIDLAALRVKDKSQLPLPSMAMGASDTVKTGDWTIVLGNPLGLQNTCTLGIVSSLDRSTGETGFDWMRHPLIQTDAAVNQGNSGGPMLNEVGEVIGMISMRALFGEGIGFAIPVDSIRTALPSLLAGKKVPRSYIGVKMAMRDDSGREHAVVDVVLDGSPAAEAGLKVGDHIAEVSGRKVRHFDEVQLAVRSLPVDSRLKLKVRRGEKSTTLVVTTADIRRLREASPASPGGRPRVVILP
ncbi:hhoA [Symbiodinium natans]|uniref:HhoA protein n=1 Tax=Symbiodinium natans TaxID=878477 RepID=A0A812RLB3_9DINO|nr:hhoA [Symbiodinium natans]